jgi:hypothetical protein
MAALAAILVPSSLTAQVNFERTYGGVEDDWALSVQQTADGGYILVGASCSFGRYQDVYAVRTNARGDTLWTRTFGGYAADCGYSVRQTDDDGFIIAGYTQYYSTDVYLIKTDPSGNMIWSRMYGGDSIDVAESVEPTTDGGFIVAGYTRSFGAGSADFYAIKTDANGDTLWTRTYGGKYCDEGRSVRQTADGGYIIVGGNDATADCDFYVVKTDAGGDTLWTRTYGGTDYDIAYAVQQTPDSGYIIAGMTRSFGAGEADVYLVKTDAEGNALWTMTYGGGSNDMGYSVQQTADGGFVIAGKTQSVGEGSTDVYIIGTDSLGHTRWTRTFGGDTSDCGYSVCRTADNGLVVAGYTLSFGAGGDDAYLMKTDSLGRIAIEEPKASPTRAPALSLTCEPNPCRGRAAISLQLTANSPAEVAIFDAGGRRVRTLTVNRAPYTVWDGKDELGHALPSGAYFIRCDVAGQHASARLVLQR